MCELFGLSSNQPISPVALLSHFRLRGGETADNPDGWGLAYREDDDFTVHKGLGPAAHSPTFSAIAEKIHSQLIIGHVRKANPPTELNLENTHPFQRTCCGRNWVFAHNGKVPEVIAAQGCCHPQHSHPAGETDSEYAFCYLLEEIASTIPNVPPDKMETWFETLMTRSTSIADYGQFNFLMSDGEYLIAYGHDRLHSQQRLNGAVRSVVIASAPLTNDAPWEAFAPGELRVYRDGQLVGKWLTPIGSPASPVALQSSAGV